MRGSCLVLLAAHISLFTFMFLFVYVFVYLYIIYCLYDASTFCCCVNVMQANALVVLQTLQHVLRNSRNVTIMAVSHPRWPGDERWRTA